MFLMFLDNFDALILKLIIFIKKILFNIFLNKKYFKKQPNNVTIKAKLAKLCILTQVSSLEPTGSCKARPGRFLAYLL